MPCERRNVIYLSLTGRNQFKGIFQINKNPLHHAFLSFAVLQVFSQINRVGEMIVDHSFSRTVSFFTKHTILLWHTM